MTPLRKRFSEDLQLAGYSKRTQESYIYSVSKLAQYFGKSPSDISNEELRHYLLYHKNKYAANTTTMALCAIKLLFEKTLQRPMPVFKLTRTKKKNKLPQVLSRQEVQQLLGSVRVLRYKALFTLLYSCGLRLREALTMQVSHIDSKRMTVRIVNGKGGTDRYVPLPYSTLKLLRQYYRTHKNPGWLFPSPGRGEKQEAGALEPIPEGSVWDVFKKVITQCKFNKQVHPHTLRHSYATHLLEDGVDIRVISAYLGHKSLESTMIYTHLTPLIKKGVFEKINALMDNLR